MKSWIFRTSYAFFDAMGDQLMHATRGDYDTDAEDAYAAYDGL